MGGKVSMGGKSRNERGKCTPARSTHHGHLIGRACENADSKRERAKRRVAKRKIAKRRRGMKKEEGERGEEKEEEKAKAIGTPQWPRDRT